jgi:Icc-related predicted phosphoesterase
MAFWNKISNSRRFRLFFATDVHGSEPTFRKFINAGKFYNVDALVLGGDIAGKMLVPIIALGNNSYRATLQSEHYNLTKDELPDFNSRLAKLGFYSSEMSENEYKELAGNPELVNRLYLDKASERLITWIQWAEEKLKNTNLRCYITGGNDDASEIVDALNRSSKERVVACEERIVSLNDEGHSMVSLGYSNPTPWNTPREIEEPELTQKIEAAFQGVDNCEKIIFNMHVPPIDSTLDTCPKLDTSTDPATVITSGGEPVLFGAGSQAVRDAIEHYQPLLSLHGHIHESRNVAKIGRTTAVNPGSEYGEGVLRGIIISIAGNKVDSTQMTSG